MDRQLAILVLNACYRASREIGEMGVMVGELAHGEPTEIKMQAGFVIAEIGRITECVYKSHPDLETYVEGQISKYGRLS